MAPLSAWNKKPFRTAREKRTDDFIDMKSILVAGPEIGFHG